MGVFTEVSDDAAAEFLSDYDIGAFDRLIPIMQGVENTNYHLFTDTGRYILTVFEGRTDLTALPFYFAAMDDFRRHGVTCPVAIMNRGRDTLGQIAGKPAAILSYLKGQGVGPREITTPLCGQVGLLAARMHIAGNGFDQERVNTVSLPYWGQLIEKCASRADKIEPGLQQFLWDEIAYLRVGWDELQTLPRGLIHADLFPDNVFVDTDTQICGVIDFYFACTDVLIYDLAITMNAWCFDPDYQFVPERFAALMVGYQSQRALSDAERRMFHFAARAASLRFLTSRLHDVLFRPKDALITPKDPREYLTRVQFHRDNPDLLT